MKGNGKQKKQWMYRTRERYLTCISSPPDGSRACCLFSNEGPLATMKTVFSVAAALLALTAGCNGGNTPSSVQTVGQEKSASTRVLETGAAALQTQPPVAAINAYLDGFHFYSGNMKAQMEAHHFCA